MILQTQSHNLAHEDRFEECLALQEKILNDVVADIRTKCAKIKGWSYSANGRVIIEFEEKLSIFYSNIFTAIDSLIHKCNIVYKYKFIYKTYSVEEKIDEQIVFEAKDIMNEVISQCDLLLLYSDTVFTSAVKRGVYKIIYEANLKNNLSYTKFISVRSGLIEHYQTLLKYHKNVKDKMLLKKIANFFERMTYSDFKDLH